jgi:hypothetical protein
MNPEEGVGQTTEAGTAVYWGTVLSAVRNRSK